MIKSKEDLAKEYWHSFKGTSLEHDEELKMKIFSSFIHGYNSGRKFRSTRQELVADIYKMLQSVDVSSSDDINLLFSKKVVEFLYGE